MPIPRGLAGTFLATVILGSAATAAAQDPVQRGQKVYAAQKCRQCHSIGGQGNKKGPLDEVGTKLTAEEVRLWIVSAPEMTKKTNSKRKPLMKSYDKLPKEDIEALVAYMQSLKKS